jgi:predicted transcriptional regulator
MKTNKRKERISERNRLRRQSIVAFLRGNPGSNRPAIIDGVIGFSAVNKQMVTTLLGELRDSGSIRKEGDRQASKWFVVSPEEPREVPVGRVFTSHYRNTKRRWENALLGLEGHVASLEEALTTELSHRGVNEDYAKLRSAVYNFLDGKTTVADLRKALGDDE